jgi:hypothetical protein
MTGLRVLLAVGTATAFAAVTAGTASAIGPLKPNVGEVAAFDTTPPLRELPTVVPGEAPSADVGERGPGSPADNGHQRDGALQTAAVANTIAPPLFTFEGPSNADNIRIYAPQFPNGVNPPDPDGDVGRNHYVAMVNLTFAIYTKQGRLLFGPAPLGSLWQNFPIDECTEPSGDPIVVYDELSDRWILTQFTTRGLASVPPAPPVPPNPFYNCVAISATDDPLGPYHRYAFVTPGTNFPDYPKYGVFGDGLYITTREFANQGTSPESIGIYAIDRKALVKGDPSPTVVSFQLAGPAYLRGDGLLPADVDGRKHPPPHSPEYFMGTMDPEFGDGAPFDGINWFEASIDFKNPASSTFELTKQIPIANFDTIFPCGVVPSPDPQPTSRDCIPQPGVAGNQYLDILSYRQRPTWRLQYRNFGQYESLVTNQSVEARPGIAGVRWWELRNPRNPVIHQEGTWAPNDGVHRWMGSVAQDRDGNLALGYSVSSATLFPGIRYAGRLAGDPLGQLSLGEASLQEGTGVNLTTNSRWGDYTSMNVDPRDDCTFYYINEYMMQIGPLAPWRTRIGAFRLPTCK